MGGQALESCCHSTGDVKPLGIPLCQIPRHWDAQTIHARLLSHHVVAQLAEPPGLSRHLAPAVAGPALMGPDSGCFWASTWQTTARLIGALPARTLLIPPDCSTGCSSWDLTTPPFPASPPVCAALVAKLQQVGHPWNNLKSKAPEVSAEPLLAARRLPQDLPEIVRRSYWRWPSPSSAQNRS